MNVAAELGVYNTTSGLRKSSTAATLFHRQIVCRSTHTTNSATGASLSPGHVFGTVFRPTCAMGTLHTAVSGVNSKRFVLMLLPGRNETFVKCAI